MYQRGGTIIAKKERIRRAATLMKDDPYTYVVCLDRDQSAIGTLYADDEQSFDYRQGHYVYQTIEFKDNVLSNHYPDKDASYLPMSWLERVKLIGLDRAPRSATLRSGSQTVELDVYQEGSAFIIRKPALSVADSFQITLNY